MLYGILGGYLDQNFSKESRVTIMLMVIGTTFLYEFGGYLLNIWLLKYTFEIMKFIKIVTIEIIYNTMITIILYPIIQTLGYCLENIYKKSNILTRYF